MGAGAGCGGIGRAAQRGADPGHPVRRFKVYKGFERGDAGSLSQAACLCLSAGSLSVPVFWTFVSDNVSVPVSVPVSWHRDWHAAARRLGEQRPAVDAGRRQRGLDTRAAGG
jgi:hypothetical protein